MIDQEHLHDLTESYLKSVISEVSDSLNPTFDSFAAFGDLGINSFQVLKIIRKLEDDFGTLPKSLLFENFNVNDLARYFADNHVQTLSARFADKLRGAAVHTGDRPPRPAAVREEAGPRTSRATPLAPQAAPIRIREEDAYSHPELKDLVGSLYARYTMESGVSRGTRKIAPNLFIGSARRGYFNYGRSKDIVVVYSYTGPRDYVPALLEEMYQYCAANGLQFNVLATEKIASICGTPFSATPFGVLQRIGNLKNFTLDGGPMRRLRYQVSKFRKTGACRTEEYRCGSRPETDQQIADVIDRWCESRTVVNPLVHDVRAEILSGALGSDHRLFLTYLDDVLQNVILITAMCAEENGYLMDLEFYRPDMPLGGLESAIVEIMELLRKEGCDLLSLGGTYGCKLEPSATADPEIDRILDELRAQNIFNDEGNLQFKNKFRPENTPIFLCRAVGSGNPDNVIDIIMMIADPLRMQTPDADTPPVSAPRREVAAVADEPAASRATPSESRPAPGRVRSADGGEDRARILSDSGFNPLQISHEQVDFDLKTDSWSQLEMPAIRAQMQHLRGQLLQPVNVDDSLRAVFPFAHFVLASSGQAAEHLFFKAWPKRGIVPQNLLFPSTIFHQIDKGFTPRELPHPSVFDLNSEEPYKGNMAWEALEALVARDGAAIPMVCIEVANNAAGGNPVSLRHLRNVKALLAGYSIPLVLDATRVVENAHLLIEREGEYAGQNLWTVVREIVSCADVVIGSLTKDFCVNKGGIIAVNDADVFQRLQDLVQEEGAGIDLIDRKLIAFSFQNRKHIEGKVLRRVDAVRKIHRALKAHDVPVVQPAGGHCILIDVRQIEEFKGFSDPVASFLAWLYVNTGIRAGAHSVGMQKATPLNDLVRLAIPVGLKGDEVDSIIERLVQAFDTKVNIPELVVESRLPQSSGGVYAKYKLLKYHNVPRRVAAKSDAADDARPLSDSSASAQPASSDNAVGGKQVFEQAQSRPLPADAEPRRAIDVAVVGMAGRYPKARDVRELWANLAAGKDCIEEIPADRYERRARYGNAAKYRGGFIDAVDRFDSLFFNISPREAELMDPQERLFLEVVWEAMEDAGYYPETLAQENGSRKIGVYVGAVWTMYQMLGVEEKYAGNEVIPNSFLWSIANRVSFALNLSGPSMAVDTACSSSLTALYLAFKAIREGELSAAIVGGVNLDLHQARFNINHQGGALSADGVCRAFGKGANGYVMGEGVGALVLKRLDQAVQDGDNIYGVIKSAAVNHGARTSGYSVPNPKAQAELISEALEEARVDARSIGYVEAHGTGTALGDPIEITALNTAFQSYGVEDRTCPIGSIKTNIGHLEAAAGVVGVSKVLLQMRQRQLVPSLHSSETNEFIDFERSPFYVVQKPEEWNGKVVDGVRLPLRAGISSFGAGGANAHIIVESYDPAPRAEAEPNFAGPLIFPLSARNEGELREAALRLAKFLQQSGDALHDVAYTLQQGRKSFEQRLAIIAETKEELIEKLTCFLDGKKNQDVTVGHAKGADGITRVLNRRDKQEFIRLVSHGADSQKIAALWVEGLLADWQGFQFPGPGKRISLPTYPFADRRHWAAGSSPARQTLQPAAGMHPMVDSNESTFERQLFKKTFHDRDFFIYDHHVSDIPTLPGVAYIEMARKAGELAAGRKVRKIRNILWISPIVVQGSASKEVFIELKPKGDTVQFEVFSEDAAGHKTPHSQGTLVYATAQDAAAEAEYVDLEGIRGRCAKVIDGGAAYPLFKSHGLNLGPSFQVLQDVYKNERETLGGLKLPDFREGDMQSMVLHPSLVDGSLQAGMAAHLGGPAGVMLVPFSIGEVEILQPLQSNCFSYLTPANADDGKGKASAVAKSNVLIVDETGKILVRIRESVGVPLRDVHKQPALNADAEGFSRLYYSYDWEKAPLAAAGAKQNSASSLVLFDTDETLRDLYRARLKETGANVDQVILVRPGETFEDSGNQSYTVDPRSKDDFSRLFSLLLERGCPVENICFAWTARDAHLRGDQELSASLERGVYSLLFVCQALIAHKLESAVQLLYLHSGKPGEVQAHNEAVNGFVNTLHLEHPRLICKTLQIRQEGDGREPMLDAIQAELEAHTQDATVVRYEAGERFIRRLKAFELEGPSSDNGIRKNGVYLITGGVGGLGLIFAEFLAKEYKARVVLTGRSALTAEREARLDELRNAGAEVLYLPADVSSEEDVRNLFNECKSRFGGINGVIHAAGVLRDSLIRNKTPEEMKAVFAPKVYGTRHLDELTKDEDLDFFVTFSSLAAVGGNGGQCDYSFANHFMDSFAAEREIRRAAGARSGKTVSLNWSIWADGGMKLDEQTEQFFKKTLGILPLSVATGLDAFVRGLSSGRSQFVVLEGIREKVDLAWGLTKKVAVPAPPPSNASIPQAASAAAAADGEDFLPSLKNDLSRIVMDLLKLEASDVAPDKILLDLGFDSIGLTGFANAVNEKLQLDITPVLFFDYPSIEEIANYLCEERKDDIRRFYRGSAAPATNAAAPQASPQQVQTATSESHQPATFGISKGWNPAALDRGAAPESSGEGFSRELRFLNEPIAIVGMSGVMPQSEDVDEFWENLKSSADMVSVIPGDRFKWEDYYGDPLKEINKTNSKWGGFMKEIDKFDPLFFGISPREAGMMDPQQRIFLETVWKAIEDSGQKVSDLSGTKTGLFVGVATNDYTDVLRDQHAALDGYSASGNSHSVLANRVSFLLNLHGPSAPIDTACSSSLVALHRAIESIHTGSSDMAIVGGVQVNLSPGAFISFGSAGMLSPDGKCKTFDKRANGYVRGEGCGAIFIKRLRDAEADGNHIYAVIKATAENHGGKVTTLTAPNSSAQTALLIEAYEKAHIDPATVGYIECHGTGTSLGDPIEIQALSKAFSELYKKHGKAPAATPHCGLSSVKTNIGHLETAAGIAAMLKALLAIKHKFIPANVHFEELNPYINLKDTPFYIVDKLTRWEAPLGPDGAPLPRRAGVSSFGFGGANAHIVLEEYIPRTPRTPAANEPRLVVLSAKNDDRLEAYVQSMRAYLEKRDVELIDFAHTLQVGRDEMPERLALVVSSTEELKHKLDEILGGGTPENCYRGSVRTKPAKSQSAASVEGEAVVRACIEGKELSRLAELWVSGAKIEWRLLYEPNTARRISVPTYPFARERHWIQEGPVSIPTERAQHEQSKPNLHPLIHRNVSTATERKFASRFNGAEFYFADHRVKTERVLPGVAYIEMIAAAGELSGGQKVRSIRNLVWLAPLTVGDDAREVDVVLSAGKGKGEIDIAVRSLDNGKLTTHCRAKLADAATVSERAMVVGAIQERCSEEIILGKDLYPFLFTSELNLGKSFQVVQKVYAGKSECLAVLKLPEHLEGGAEQFRLHPSLLDGAVHTAIGMVKRRKAAMPWSVPYSVAEVQIFGSLKDAHYAHAAWDLDGVKDGSGLTKIQIHLLTRDGRVLLRMRDFVAKSFRPAAMQTQSPDAAAQVGGSRDQKEEPVLQSLLPVWNAVRPEISSVLSPESSRILLLGGGGMALDWVRRSYPSAQQLELASSSSIDIFEAIEKKLGDVSFDQLLWIAPDATSEAGPASGGDDRLIDRQEEGVLAVFRIVKALLQQGYATKNLRWTIVISRTQRVTVGEAIQPAHAGIVGLVGSLAKEYPHWDLRLLDIDSIESVSAHECLSLPWDKQGNGLVRRQGEWFQQGLALVEALPEATPVYRQQGVYVVIGGAGGVGEVWSRFMIEHYQANVVWIGRRESNAAIEKKINALSRLGPAPLYVSADATDLAALEQASKTILKTYPAIHGVVHSAIVLHDQSIARMDEQTFRASLSAKVDVSVNLDKVFGKEELDFMLFFSSIISFVKSPGQSNYAAGCTFKDSFAHELQRRHAYPVKIMNWGYWGDVGVVADESYKKMMAQMGIGSIEAPEGMASLQALVQSEVHQLALIKTLNRQATAGLNLSHVIAYSPEAAPAILPQAQQALSGKISGEPLTALEAELPTAEMNDLVTELVASSLMSVGLFSNGIHRIAELSLDKPPAPYYERWLSSSIRYLQQQNVLAGDLTLARDVRPLADLWSEWETKRAVWGISANLQAQIALLEACLKALPSIVTGRQRATDVMFPGSSMSLVEGVYRGNSLADHFNTVLCETLIACVEQQLAADPGRKIRILEIGAGTGGTTAALLPALRQYPIEEYCYTDVSKAFLMLAEAQFRPQFPALTTALFDVSKPLALQSIAAGHYDFAIAANVLHATPDIRETVRNTKATLKSQGVLLLNEISVWSLFNHLTFGLLEGWWLHEDTAVRLPGNPGLAPERWRALLADEGFASIFFPAEEAHRFGQQIVAARSDGWARQRIVKQAPAQPETPKVPARADARGTQRDLKVTKAAASKNKRTVAGPPPAAEVTPLMSNDSIRKIITEKLSESLRMDTAAIRSDAPFADYGVDSIIGVNLVRSISEALQIELETTSLFEYSTVDQLSEYIAANWQPSAPRGEDRYEVHPSSEARFDDDALFADAADAFDAADSDAGRVGVEPIAIIGMSGRFAESESLDAFWENLARGKNLIRKVSRWAAADCVMSESAGQAYCSDGSFLDSADQFDPAFFGISPLEATYMDPQQRLFLEESWRALEDAGYANKSGQEKQCGVYVGCGTSNYTDLFLKEPPPQAWWGNSHSVVPARIAYHLNLQGPAMVVDTACSSALVAIHMACQGLWSRETEMALAGGVYVQATSAFHKVANRAGMLTPDGRCYSFDARANGFAPGEAVGVIVLKRLRDALRDGDHIRGVIAGSGINQDGSSNGLIAPNARAQERLERSVYERFNINPESIQMVEAHGTATIMGDSIECLAISRAFREYTDEKQFCAIGSVKTNIGHAGNAAGIAGVLKVLLSLERRQIPPSLHFEKANPAIDFESSPFYVNTELKEWRARDGQKLRAAVSAFGFSGTNAHLVLEEPPSAAPTADDAPGYVVVLSARTAEQLKMQARNLLALVRGTSNLSMNDLSYSLFVGRTHLAHRLSCVARNQRELVALLEQWIETGTANRVHTSEIAEGRVRELVSFKKTGNYCIQECRTLTDAASYLENLTAIAELYVQGYSLNFEDLFPEGSKRMPLPTYPFAKERYWVDDVYTAAQVSAAVPARLHPLLHTNTSTLGRQSYRSTLTSADVVLEDHQPGTDGHGGQRVLPVAAYLEMARAAIEDAQETPLKSTVVELQDVVWGEPLVVAGRQDVTIALSEDDDERISYEISSGSGEQEIVYCQGHAVFVDRPLSATLDIDGLRMQLRGQALGTESVYAEFASMGAYYGPAQRSITAIHQGDGQALAQLSTPPGETGSESGGHDSRYILHPSVVSGALQAGSWLVHNLGQGSSAVAASPRTVGHLRILSPCTEEMFAWARLAENAREEDELLELDIDLVDTRGNLCVEMRGVSFHTGHCPTAPAPERTWLFSKEQLPATTGGGMYAGSMGAMEKMTTFLRQETALQLRKGIDEIPTDRSYFDLGLTSLAMANLLQSTCKLLDENLNPSMLFEYRDVDSLATYLVNTYPGRIDAVTAVRQGDGRGRSVERPEIHGPRLTPFPRKRRPSGAVVSAPGAETSVPAPRIDTKIDQILDRVSWQEASLDDGYEKVTF